MDPVIFQRTVCIFSHNCEKFLQSFVFFVQEKRVLFLVILKFVVVMVKWFFFFVLEKIDGHTETETERQSQREN
jgi:hypothetical protein